MARAAAPAAGRPRAQAETREPPHSNDAEQSVLGGLLLDNSARARAGDLLTEDDFYRFDHRHIYAAIGRLIAAGEQADVITVFEQLQGLGKAEECGGRVYLNALAASVPSAANMRHYAEIVRERAVLRKLVAASDEIASAAFNPSSRDLSHIVQAAQRSIAEVAAAAAPSRPAFGVVDLAKLREPPTPQEWFWAGYVPAGHLTLLGGHGGAGKSMLGLMMAVSIAAGAEFLGRPTKRATVCLFSAEDPADLVLRRLRHLCETMLIDVASLDGYLHVLDATEDVPALFVERRIDGGIKTGVTTATYEALAAFVQANAVDVLILDNASDTFDGDEVNRALVRHFITALVRIVRPRDGAVVLLAHVDKATSRAGKGLTNSESYSGSTAWHNGARSRLFLVQKEPGSLELLHQKCNLAPTQPPLALEWPEHGVPQVVRPLVEGGPMQKYLNTGDVRALLALVHEFNGRGEFIATSPNSRNHAVKLLGDEPTFPKRKPTEIFALLRDAERDGRLLREVYRDRNRKERERWVLTPKGLEFLGIAPGAPCAPSAEITAPEPGANGARQVRHVRRGGYGGVGARAKRGAQETKP